MQSRRARTVVICGVDF